MTETDNKKGGIRLAEIEDCVDTAVKGLKDNTKKPLITVAKNGTDNVRTNRKTNKTRKQKWQTKQLYIYFK